MEEVINNAFYDELGENWYHDSCHPIALLRAENAARTPWIAKKILNQFMKKPCVICDQGCGAGFLANALAKEGHHVVGVDLSAKSLATARAHDETKSVAYLKADASKLPFEDESFDVVTSLDFLEHIEDPKKTIDEAARVLKPGGLFFFHTFNRNPICWLVVVKGVEWFVKNTPKKMHVYKLLVRPSWVKKWCQENDMEVKEIHGVNPKIDRAFFKMLRTGEVPDDLTFHMTKSTTCGYLGYAKKLVKS